jgi:hypothetical protein
MIKYGIIPQDAMMFVLMAMKSRTLQGHDLFTREPVDGIN